MKRLVVCAVVVAAYLLGQAGSGYWVPVWNGSRYEWPRLGPSFVVKGGQVDVLVPPVPQRSYGVRVQPDARGRYVLPAQSPKGVVIYINGLRATEGVDYQLSGAEITPLWAWGTQDLVVADFDGA